MTPVQEDQTKFSENSYRTRKSRKSYLEAKRSSGISSVRLVNSTQKMKCNQILSISIYDLIFSVFPIQCSLKRRVFKGSNIFFPQLS